MTRKQTAIYLQNACLQHRYIRNQDLSNVVERPERLRAVNIGLAAAVAHLEELFASNPKGPSNPPVDPEDLASVLGKLNLDSQSSAVAAAGTSLGTTRFRVPIIQSEARVDILRNEAVKFIHGDIDGDVYLETLQKWVKESLERITQGESEIPEGYSQGDLYLCPESLKAIEGALGTVCEAVDAVVSKQIDRAFVAIRPPGHHCGEDTPSGFCFVNNVAVAAAHAHLKHGINRIVIFDIDLHHGNGTQSIVWQINEESYRQKLEQEAGASPQDRFSPQIYYGSLHDILSYPCEDGKPDLVQAASTSIHNAHGQFIQNVHLQTYTSQEHFFDTLYPAYSEKLFGSAAAFLDATAKDSLKKENSDVMFFISCGLDACEHEYESMSRHNRKVPTSFYRRFARDACALAERYGAAGVISVLEGGYSDRALTSGSMAHLVGLTDIPEGVEVDESWWDVENLIELEKATKKRRGGRPSLPAPGSTRQWIERTLNILAPLDSVAASIVSSLKAPPPVPSMTLRDRSKGNSKAPTPAASPPRSARGKGASVKVKAPRKSDMGSVKVKAEPVSSGTSSNDDEDQTVQVSQKKLPRVILKLGGPKGGGAEGLS